MCQVSNAILYDSADGTVYHMQHNLIYEMYS
jgi:hypothetical protein